ncbi:MAG: ATP-binding protein, partial [Gammaproteobacteria bacterium]
QKITEDTPPMDIIRLIFEPGFSSKDEAGIDAGRGVGLDLVKELADKYKARISVGYKEGKYCVFRIKFPAIAVDQGVAA